MSLLVSQLGGGGPTIIETDANSSGVATCTGLAAALWNSLGSSTGLATTTGTAAAVWNSLGSSDGSATVTGISAGICASTGASAGLAVTDGISGAIAGSVGVSSGLASTNGLAAWVWASLGSSDGFATAIGISGALWSVIGNSTGLAIGSADAENAGIVPPVDEARGATGGAAPWQTEAWRKQPYEVIWELPPPAFPPLVSTEILTLTESPIVPQWIQGATTPRPPRRGLQYRTRVHEQTSQIQRVLRRTIVSASVSQEIQVVHERMRSRRQKQQQEDEELILALLMQGLL